MKVTDLVANGRSATSVSTLLLIALLPLALSLLVASWFFGFSYAPSGIIADALISFLVVSSFALFVRGPAALWVIGFLVAFLPLANAIKIGFLGAPLLPSDVPALWALVTVLPGWRRAIAVLGLLAFLLPLFWALRPARSWLRGVVALTASSLLIFAAGYILHQAAENDGRIDQLRTHGAHLHLSMGLNALLDRSFSNKSKEDVQVAIKGLGLEKAHKPGDFTRRNIHLVLLESVWDPLALKHYEFSRDPFDPRFRALLESAGSPSVMVPTFGGATANAEFEMLCGLPASDESVVFRDALDRDMPCLPRMLREAGYRTVASHPFKQDYWSRNAAYPHVGFEYYEPEGAFEFDDMDGSFLSDASTFRQVRQAFGKTDDRRPLFQYVVSLSSHYPYSRNRKLRPDLVTVRPQAPLLEDYANAVAYTTKAFMDHVEAIQASDPEALIIAVGDHAPVLGPNPDPYALSGLSLSSAVDRANAIPVVSRTPLVMIDGSKGVINLGEVPLRALPTLILRQLGEHGPRLPYGAGQVQESLRWGSRSFQNEYLVKSGQGWVACASKDKSQQIQAQCDRAGKVRSWLMTLRQDVAEGEQYALGELSAPLKAQQEPMKIENRYGSCGLSVSNWGPQTMVLGEAFNVQSSGSSALWFSLENGRGEPKLMINGQSHEILLAGEIASVSLDAVKLFNKPGSYPLQWVCDDGSKGVVGTFIVTDSMETGKSAVASSVSKESTQEDTCKMSVKDWGPRTVTIGSAFNRQPDGKDAIWMIVEERVGQPDFMIDGHRMAGIFSGDSASLSIDSALIFKKPGEYPLKWICGTGLVGDVGTIKVIPSE